MTTLLHNRVDAYCATDLERMADRALEMQAAGVIIQTVSVDLYVSAIKALARERRRNPVRARVAAE